MTDTDFLPDGYEAPKGDKNYMKFQDGANRFRIMDSPLIGWLDWDEKKPIRSKLKEEPTVSIDSTKPYKHFWALPVWNYAEKAIQILEITQKTVFGKIENYAKSADWGNPREYDLEVTKTGSGLETEYETIAIPPQPISVEIADAWEKITIDMEKLWTGDDPFIKNDQQ